MVKIRTAKAEDKESIQSIYESLVGSHASQDETIWDRLIQTECLLVAETEGQIIGFGGIDLNATEQVKWFVDRSYCFHCC